MHNALHQHFSLIRAALLCSYGSILPLLALDATLIVYLHLSIVVDIISAFAFYTISMSLVKHYGTVIIV